MCATQILLLIYLLSYLLTVRQNFSVDSVALVVMIVILLNMLTVLYCLAKMDIILVLHWLSDSSNNKQKILKTTRASQM